MGESLMAVVAEGNRERVYLTPTQCMESVALIAHNRRGGQTHQAGLNLGQ